LIPGPIWKMSCNDILIDIIRVTRRVSLVEQEQLTLPEHLSLSPVFSVVSCYSIFSFMCIFCRSLFVLLYFFFWTLCCLFFDLQILIIPLVPSNSSYRAQYWACNHTKEIEDKKRASHVFQT
jgi:hypothetical protein